MRLSLSTSPACSSFFLPINEERATFALTRVLTACLPWNDHRSILSVWTRIGRDWSTHHTLSYLSQADHVFSYFSILLSTMHNCEVGSFQCFYSIVSLSFDLLDPWRTKSFCNVSSRETRSLSRENEMQVLLFGGEIDTSEYTFLSLSLGIVWSEIKE